VQRDGADLQPVARHGSLAPPRNTSDVGPISYPKSYLYLARELIRL